MKSKYSVFAAAFCLLLAGCKYGEVAHVWPSLGIERIQFCEREIATFRALVEKPVVSGAYARQQKAIDEWIAEVASFGNCSNSTVEAVLETMSAKLAENVATEKRETEGESWQMEALSYWYFDLDAQVAYADDEYLAYQVCLDEFEGWLHPLRNYNWRVWSFGRGRELSAEDIFKKESIPDVIALVKEDMAYRHDCTNFVQYAETCLIEDFEELPKNFTFDDRGIKFLFNAYEIACYAEGDIRGFVGWERLAPYVKPDLILPGSRAQKVSN